MQYYGVFDSDGLPVGFYCDAVHEGIPATAIAIPASVYEDLLGRPGERRYNFTTGRTNKYTPPGPTPAEIAAAERLAQYPNLEPDQFWFVMRVSGYQPDLLAWVAAMNDPSSPNYSLVEWAQASAKLEFAKFFERDHPFVEAAREAIGLAPAELDALWAFGSA